MLQHIHSITACSSPNSAGWCRSLFSVKHQPRKDRHFHGRWAPCCAQEPKRASPNTISLEDDRIRLRSEAEAPFRSLRLTLYGFSTISASLGLLISIPQLIGALGGARNALELNDVLVNIGVNFGAAALFAFLFKKDLEARDRQMARLGREEKLAALTVQLSNNKVLALSDLRGSARVVVVAGTTAQVKDALEAAEPYKQELMRRGVLVVPLPIYRTDDETDTIPPPLAEDLRWRVTPLRLDDWSEWFKAQLKLSSKATSDRGLFVGLRLDGRVRASGQGMPPWPRFAAELAPLEGEDAWTSFFDGFDGRVSPWQ